MTEDRFTYLLKSDAIILDSDVAFVKDAVREDEEALLAAESQIDELEKRLARLLRGRDEIAERLSLRRSILSPIRRLPPEILGHIFSMTMSQQTEHVPPPWILGLVSRAWRIWALSQSSLWSSITIPPIESASEVESSVLPRLQEQLNRTHDRPLHVFWSGSTYSTTSSIATLLLQCCERWSTLHLSGFRSAHSCRWLEAARGRLPLLRRLEVFASASAAIPDVFSIVPSLRVALLFEPGDSDFLPFVTLPWDQLTHYAGVYDTHRQFEIFQAALHLQECIIGVESAPIHVTRTLALPYLRRLHSENVRLFDNLTAPCLTQLAIISPGADDWGDLTNVLPFVQRSVCTLTTLSLINWDMSPQILDVLWGLPHISHLAMEIRFGDLTPLFEALSTPSGAGVSEFELCPRLESFVFGCPRGTELNGLCSMVRSRMRPKPCAAGLVTFRFFESWSRNPSLDPALEAQVNAMRDEGLDIAGVSWNDPAVSAMRWGNF